MSWKMFGLFDEFKAIPDYLAKHFYKNKDIKCTITFADSFYDDKITQILNM